MHLTLIVQVWKKQIKILVEDATPKTAVPTMPLLLTHLVKTRELQICRLRRDYIRRLRACAMRVKLLFFFKLIVLSLPVYFALTPCH